VTGICTSPYLIEKVGDSPYPYKSPYSIEKIGDSPYPYPYPYPVNARIFRQNRDRFK